MEIIKFKKIKSNLYEINLSDNTSLRFYDDTIIKYNLLTKKIIDDKLLEEINKYNKFSEAYYRSIAYIKKKLRTKLEIEKYLSKYQYELDVIEKTIDKLEKQKYINEDNYLKSYINDQVNLTNNGPLKIIHNLENLGFNNTDINDVLDTIEKDVWMNKINKLINKKVLSNKNNTEKELKNKIKIYLNNLGYESNIFLVHLNNVKINNIDINNKIIDKEYHKLLRKYKGKELEYKLKQKLYSKGITVDEIDNYLQNL